LIEINVMFALEFVMGALLSKVMLNASFTGSTGESRWVREVSRSHLP